MNCPYSGMSVICVIWACLSDAAAPVRPGFAHRGPLPRKGSGAPRNAGACEAPGRLAKPPSTLSVSVPPPVAIGEARLGALLRLAGSPKSTKISMACRIGIGSVLGRSFGTSERDWLAIL